MSSDETTSIFGNIAIARFTFAGGSESDARSVRRSSRL
jgi:hypothetical protein